MSALTEARARMAGPPIRVLVVDDTVVVRRLVSDVLDSCPDIEVVGTAAHGGLALQQIAALKPDVMTLDIEMPVMDGLATLRAMRPLYPDLPVIMFSTLTERGASATLDALALGANDYVTKPTSNRDRAAAIAAVESAIVPLVRFWGRQRPKRPAPVRAAAVARTPAPAIAPRPHLTVPVQGVVIGISTGGPAALSQLVPELPSTLSVPVVIVQHMPPVFTRMLAERLNVRASVTVVEAEHGMVAEPGHVYIAAGGRHLVMDGTRGSAKFVLDDGPLVNSCRPSVDVTMQSAARVWGAGTLGVVMTGMGNDGLEGARTLRALGARILAQDEESSVVWGMPGSIVRDKLADAILPLDDIASAVVHATDGASTLTGTATR